MRIRFRRPAIAALAISAFVACDVPATDPAIAAAGGPNAAGVVASPVTLEWQQKARALVAEARMSPFVAARLLAGTGMAAMRAVEAVDAQTGAPVVAGNNGNGYGPGGRSRYEARRGAVAGASARVLAWFAPAAAADLEAMVAAQGGSTVHPAFTRGVEIGRAMADEVIEHVANDNFTRPWTGTIPVGPGLWTTTVMPPGGATLGQATPWFLTSGSQFRPAPPPAYLSPAFNADLAEVLAIATSRTTAQRDIALKWAYGAGTYTPVGYWNELAATYVGADRLDERQAATVFGLLGAAVFDALIASFEAKYHYWTMRPHQADPAITTVFAVPNYPAYPSGHGSVSGASGRILTHFFPQRAAEIDALVTEAAMSRIYAGIHYRHDQTAARTMSEQVADWVIQQAGL